jgi:ERCC4-type nuclease
MKKPKQVRPKIEFDVFEKDNKVTAALKEFDGVDVDIKNAETWNGHYTPTGDYVITDRAGNNWGIERKSFIDCIGSIRDKRIYGQLAQLMDAYPQRAILLIEDPTYIPRKLARNKVIENQLRESVLTFGNEQSAMMMVWRVNSPKHAARMMVKWAKTAHKRVCAGRGITVTLDNGQGNDRVNGQ